MPEFEASTAPRAGRCPSEAELVDFLGGIASDAEREVIERHIDRCERCASTLALFGDAYVTSTADDGDSGQILPTPEIKRDGFAGRYQIRECVGFGAGGTVYRAYDPELDREVALKVLQTGPGGSTQPELRWTREAQVMAKVVHPNVVTVHDVGLAGDSVFIATEFVDGGSLAEWLDANDHARTFDEILEVFVEAGRGLAAIHERGLVHRDFKPHNVMVGRDGRSRVTDFGLARILPDLDDMTTQEETDQLPELSGSRMAETLVSRTRTGTIVGTPSYMSPEQWQGRVADARSDQFSFCVALFEALYGVRPFEGRTAVELAEHVCAGRMIAIPSTGTGKVGKVPRWVVAVLVRGMSVEADRRFADMNAMLRALSDGPRRARRRWSTAALAAGFLAVGVGSYGLASLPDDDCAPATERLHGVWDEPVQAQVEQALRSVPAVAQDVADSVDTWTKQWLDVGEQACHAAKAQETVSEREYELQVACLDRRLSELRAATGVLTQLDAGAASDAIAVLDTMASPERCGDVAHLETLEPSFSSPEARRLSRQLVVDIDRVDALRLVGDLDPAIALAREIVAKADANGDPAVRAEALLALGETLSAAKATTEAESVLRDAVWAAEASGHVEKAAAGWIELVQVVGAQGERYEEGERAAERAAAAVHRLGDPEQELALASNLAVVASARGDYEEALRAHRDVFRKATAVLGPEHRQVARMQFNLVAVLVHLGRLDEAYEHAEAGLALQRKLFPNPHPATVEMLNSTGALHVHAGRLDEAREVLLEALAEAEATLPPVHASIATVLSNLAQVDIAQGHPEDALPRYERVLEIYRTIHPEPHADLSNAMHNYASTFDALEQRERAVELYREALQLRIDTMGATHPATAGTMHNLGLILALHFEDERAEEGVGLLEKALELRLAADVDPYLRATTSFMLARAYEKRGEHDAAIAKAEQSRGYLRQIQPRHADILAHVEAWLAKKQAG